MLGTKRLDRTGLSDTIPDRTRLPWPQQQQQPAANYQCLPIATPLAHRHVTTSDKPPQPNDDHPGPIPIATLPRTTPLDSITHCHVTKDDYLNSITDCHINCDDDVPCCVDSDDGMCHHHLQVSFIPHLPPSPPLFTQEAGATLLFPTMRHTTTTDDDVKQHPGECSHPLPPVHFLTSESGATSPTATWQPNNK